MSKALIIRFSSFGDLLHIFPVTKKLKSLKNMEEVHWVTRSDFQDLVKINPFIDKVWSLNRQNGLVGLIRLALLLRKERYTHIYDAHNNIRSHILSLLLTCFRWVHFLRRPKFRWRRILLVRFKINLFDWPFRCQKSYITPLKPWGVSQTFGEDFYLSLPKMNQDVAQYIGLIPSSAWPQKTWPKEHWLKLIDLMPEQKFVVFGGGKDQICHDIAAHSPLRTMNMAGSLSHIESLSLASQTQLVVGNDTGLTHGCDLLGHKSIMFIGPAAFGYPSNPNTLILETDLPCKPCSKDGRGICTNPVNKKCLWDITPEMVVAAIHRKLAHV